MDSAQSSFRSAIRLESVQRCLVKTVSAITSTWRCYESIQNYRSRCLYAIWELLSQRSDFKSEKELVYYLFGNQHKKNLVYWNVENQLRRDSGIKSFDGPKHVELDSFNGSVNPDEIDRERILRRLEDVFNRDILTHKEKAVLVLSFNLSLMEEEREEGDTYAWSTEEIAIVIGITEKEVQLIRKRALSKLKPHLVDLK